MESFGERLYRARTQKNLTQVKVAEHLHVTNRLVSLWEHDESSPSIEMLPKLARLYQVSTDWLLCGSEVHFKKPKSDRIFDEKKMYTYICTYAKSKNLNQTLSVLPHVRELHNGQIRKGKEQVPFISHPLLVACHALALGMEDDVLISAALLHDTCEDCNVSLDQLPIDEQTKELVKLLTKTPSANKMTDKETLQYYDSIFRNPKALLIKLLDRCNNISTMASGFSNQKIVSYIDETETYFFPMIRRAKTQYPQYSNQFFLIKYHIVSVIGSLKHQMQHYE